MSGTNVTATDEMRMLCRSCLGRGEQRAGNHLPAAGIARSVGAERDVQRHGEASRADQ